MQLDYGAIQVEWFHKQFAIKVFVLTVVLFCWLYSVSIFCNL